MLLLGLILIVTLIVAGGLVFLHFVRSREDDDDLGIDPFIEQGEPDAAEKGARGEAMVKSHLAEQFDSKIYQSLHDLTIPTPYDGGTTQIDHVLVSKYGVFVVETKNYGGRITGDRMWPRWRQVMPSGKKSYFGSPLKQNDKHLKELAKLLHLPASAFHSLIIFIDGSNFVKKMPNNVRHLSTAAEYIRAQKTTHLSQAQVNSVVATIHAAALPPGEETNKLHRAHVEKLRAAARQTARERAKSSKRYPSK